ILVFSGQGVVTRYPGGYESYVSLRDQYAAATEPTAVSAPAPRSPKPQESSSSAPKPLTFAERKELDGILEEITALEQTITELDAKLVDPLLFARDPDAAKRVHADHALAHERLAGRTTRWEELEARRDVRKSRG
ncbi:MAG TPA: ABC transporter ATP-binding protein, partial [Polyangiaceae bacterium]